MFTETTATRKILELKKRIRGIAGGTSASKTISILLWLIDYAQTHNSETISVVSETLPHLKKGAIRDFLNIMSEPRLEHSYFDLYGESSWNKTDNIFTFPNTKSKIEFFSADQPGKVRGPRRQVLFINEANNIPFETFDQLEVRTEKVIWLDWNPVSSFWWYEDDQGGPGVKDREDADFLRLTYRDNEALPESIVKTIEMRRNKPNWWKVYGEGELGEAEGRIYTGWMAIDEVPHEARLERYGVDFGYTNDPTAIVAVYYYNGGYILNEIAYQKGLSNKDIADLLKNQEQATIIADSAEPKSIDEIRSYGLSIIPTVKGKDSVNQGIQFVQDQKISYTKRSVNLQKEYRNYLWLKDPKTDKALNEPSDIWNHCMDAIRYAFDSLKPQTPIPSNLNDFSKWRI